MKKAIKTTKDPKASKAVKPIVSYTLLIDAALDTTTANEAAISALVGAIQDANKGADKDTLYKLAKDALKARCKERDPEFKTEADNESGRVYRATLQRCRRNIQGKYKVERAPHTKGGKGRDQKEAVKEEIPATDYAKAAETLPDAIAFKWLEQNSGKALTFLRMKGLLK